MIGADTGHRYTERVFSRHQEALDPRTLKPHEITDLADLAPPWSAMEWNRRSYDVRTKKHEQHEQHEMEGKAS